MYRLRIRSGPSKIREKWENTVCLLFIFRFRAENTAFWLQTGKKPVNTLCFPLFRELGGSWIYRLRIGARRGEQKAEVPTGVETKTEEQTERKTQPETQAEVETEAKSRVEAQTERNEVRSGSAANPLLPKVGITTKAFTQGLRVQTAHLVSFGPTVSNRAFEGFGCLGFRV